MSADPKAATTGGAAAPHREKGVKVFTYPKIVFILPTLVMSLICWIGMMVIHDKTDRPSNDPTVAEHRKQADDQRKAQTQGRSPLDTPDFSSTQNLLALTFLAVFALNVLVMTFDFPRFAVLAGVLIVTTVTFLLLWIGTQFDWLRWLYKALDSLYLAANSGFYFIFSLILIVMYGIIFTTRWLDYWEFLPNEILHHHGPWSDLERFPTMQLKFDKEIPDVFEHFLFGAGRLVIHVAGEQKSIILDNVLHINKKEQALKSIMSRLEVRVTTDQEANQT
jgi:hypothetical protein